MRKLRGADLTATFRWIALEALRHVAERYKLPAGKLIEAQSLSAPAGLLGHSRRSQSRQKRRVAPLIREERMSLDEFWPLMDQSRSETRTCDEQAEVLAGLLRSYDPRDIVDFNQNLADLLAKSKRWDLWAVAGIIYGGCSDDAFEDFRGWLIAQGRAVFDSVMENPERAADLVAGGEDPECEAILYAANSAYQSIVGEQIPDPKYDYFSEPEGKAWKQEQLRDIYPEIWKRLRGADLAS